MPNGLELPAGLAVDVAKWVVLAFCNGIREDWLAKQGVNPVARSRGHIRVNARLDSSHHGSPGSTGFFLFDMADRPSEHGSHDGPEDHGIGGATGKPDIGGNVPHGAVAVPPGEGQAFEYRFQHMVEAVGVF